MSDFSLASGTGAAVVLGAVFLPTIVAAARGARDNHMGGILALNLVAAACWLGSSYLGLAALAALPVVGLMSFALMAWAFIAPGRVQDRVANQRHAELLAALRAAQRTEPEPGSPEAKQAYWDTPLKAAR